GRCLCAVGERHAGFARLPEPLPGPAPMEPPPRQVSALRLSGTEPRLLPLAGPLVDGLDAPGFSSPRQLSFFLGPPPLGAPESRHRAAPGPRRPPTSAFRCPPAPGSRRLVVSPSRHLAVPKPCRLTVSWSRPLRAPASPRPRVPPSPPLEPGLRPP